MLTCAVTLTLYDYLLTLDDEVRQRFNPLRFHLLTRPSPRFAMFGGAVRRGVRSVVRTGHAGRADIHTVRQSPIFISWYVSPDQLLQI